MVRTKKPNIEMRRTKLVDKRSKFIWCPIFKHFQHVQVCSGRCKEAKYCETFIRYEEGV